MIYANDVQRGWALLSWEGEAQWFATKQSRVGKKVLGGRVKSLDQLIGTVRNAEDLHWDLYLNANPSRSVPGKTKLSRDDITNWRYIVIDLDPGPDMLSPPEPLAATGSARYLRLAHHIFSGRGHQFWLPIKDQPRPHCCTGWHPYEQIMRGYLHDLSVNSAAWAPGWIIDTSCSDLARVVRCPGSINQKTGHSATVMDISTSALDKMALEEYNIGPPPVQKPNIHLTNLLETLPHLTVRARKFIMEGSESPGRHTSCYAACKSLLEVGIGRDRALEWLLIGAGHCSLPLEDVQRIVRQVYEQAAPNQN